jgi:signal transduction histidine kinase
MEALLGGYLIRRFSTPAYFKTVEDIFIFLIPASLLSALVASTIGVTALALYGAISNIPYTWFTFWLGDTLGIYILTPLLVVWLTPSIRIKFSEYQVEAFLMVLTFALLGVFNFVWNYPLLHLYIPLTIWVTYRFRMHGATLAILLISISAIIPTSQGLGSVYNILTSNQLLLLVSFLEVIVFLSLILAAVINERQTAWDLLKTHNIDLQEKVNLHVKKLREMHSEIFIKDKLASLGMLMLGASKQILGPLSQIHADMESSNKSLTQLNKIITDSRHKLDPEAVVYLEEHFKELNTSLENISRNNLHAKKILDILHQQSSRSLPGKAKIKSVNLHTLLDMCIHDVMTRKRERYPQFKFDVILDYDPSVTMLPVLNEELAYAFMHVIDNAIDSLYEKKKNTPDNYLPELIIRTTDHRDHIEITFHDNGEGMPANMLENLFTSLQSTKPPEESTGLGLFLAHDIIKHVHHGEIKANSIEDEFFEIVVSLPKPSQKFLNY